MKKDIIEKIEIPEGVEVEVNHETVIAKAGEKKIEKKFNLTNISLKVENKEIVVESKKATRRESKMIGTIKAHLKNILEGLTKGFEYKLVVEYVHFPITVEKKEKEIIIKGFLGEKKPRKCQILEGSEVEIGGSDITIKSHNKEIVGQMAANLEKCTKVVGKDKRKFEDGIYITQKAGRKL